MLVASLPFSSMQKTFHGASGRGCVRDYTYNSHLEERISHDALYMMLCQDILAPIRDAWVPLRNLVFSNSFQTICEFVCLNFTQSSSLFTSFTFFFFYSYLFFFFFHVPLFTRELMSQTRERRRRRVWGRRTPPRGRPIPRHRAVRSRKSLSNQLRTC